jgi:hypothetical protein
LDEEEIMTKEESELLLLFVDDGATNDKKEFVATADMPKEITEDWHNLWNDKNRLTIRLIKLLRSTNFDFDSKSMGLQILRNVATYEVSSLARFSHLFHSVSFVDVFLVKTMCRMNPRE